MRAFDCQGSLIRLRFRGPERVPITILSTSF